jgi:hypothetical protein
MSLISLDLAPRLSAHGAMTDTTAHDPIAPPQMRYIKLGAGGRWAAQAIARAELHFGYGSVPHGPCAAGNWAGVSQLLREQGRTAGAASLITGAIRDFYTLGPESLWITFHAGLLHWGFAAPEVTWLGRGGDGDIGERSRPMIGGWRSTDLKGAPLRMAGLSTRLTQLATFRGTLCEVSCPDYLVRRINGVPEPVLDRARALQAELLEVAGQMVAQLHWADFETLVDLVFARSGWQRVSRVGGTQADVDMWLVQPATREQAFVQVKAKAGQGELEDYLARFEASGVARMFFVCHSLKGRLHVPERADVQVWTGLSLIERVIEAGLFGWLMERVA